MGLGTAAAAAPPFSASIINHRHAFSLPSSASSLLLPASRRCGLRSFTSRSVKKGWVGRKAQVEERSEEEACELVNGTEVIVEGNGSESVRAQLFQAVKNNNGTGILLLSDVFGFQDSSTRDFAYRTSCNGYNVLVPDLFRGNPWRQEQPWSEFEQWLARQDEGERVSEDIEACTKWMVDELGITSKLGIIGFCYGGGQVVKVLARDHGSCFATGVSFYGTRIDNSAAAHVKVPLLFIAGDNDPLCPLEGLTETDHFKLVVFNGRGHSFAHRPQSNEEDTDAEKAFLIMRNWLHRHLISNVL